MQRRQERKPAEEPAGCLGKMGEIFLIDLLLQPFFDACCSGCLGMFFTACIAVAALAHGAFHLLHHHRAIALTLAPLRTRY